jgi:hypothetical protein
MSATTSRRGQSGYPGNVFEDLELAVYCQALRARGTRDAISVPFPEPDPEKPSRHMDDPTMTRKTVAERVDAFFGDRLTITHPEAAKFLEMHTGTLRQLEDEGRIVYGGRRHRRYLREHLVAYLEAEPATEPGSTRSLPLSSSATMASGAARSSSTTRNPQLISTPRLERRRREAARLERQLERQAEAHQAVLLQNWRPEGKPFSFRHVIRSWPSIADFARSMEVPYATAYRWWLRDSIPPAYWNKLKMLAEPTGLIDAAALSPQDLMRLFERASRDESRSG